MLAHRPRSLQLSGWCWIALIGLAGCSDAKGDFTAGRSDDPCNATEPVCNDTVGCTLDDSSYISGTFPNTLGKFMVTTSGPASVEIHLFLINPTAGGTTTTLTWFEATCSANFQTSVLGSIVVGEAQANGEFVRSQDLAAAGDHLITYSSDVTAKYLLKVSVIPKI